MQLFICMKLLEWTNAVIISYKTNLNVLFISQILIILAVLIRVFLWNLILEFLMSWLNMDSFNI